MAQICLQSERRIPRSLAYATTTESGRKLNRFRMIGDSETQETQGRPIPRVPSEASLESPPP